MRSKVVDFQAKRAERVAACEIAYPILSLNVAAVQAITNPRPAIDVAQFHRQSTTATPRAQPSITSTSDDCSFTKPTGDLTMNTVLNFAATAVIATSTLSPKPPNRLPRARTSSSFTADLSMAPAGRRSTAACARRATTSRSCRTRRPRSPMTWPRPSSRSRSNPAL